MTKVYAYTFCTSRVGMEEFYTTTSDQGGAQPARRLSAIIKMLATLALLWPASAYASCDCLCVNGKAQPSCTSAWDVTPICSQQKCPPVTPSRPVNAPVVMPIGVDNCGLEQVENPTTHDKSWERVCH